VGFDVTPRISPRATIPAISPFRSIPRSMLSYHNDCPNSASCIARFISPPLVHDAEASTDCTDTIDGEEEIRRFHRYHRWRRRGPQITQIPPIQEEKSASSAKSADTLYSQFLIPNS